MPVKPTRSIHNEDFAHVKLKPRTSSELSNYNLTFPFLKNGGKMILMLFLVQNNFLQVMEISPLARKLVESSVYFLQHLEFRCLESYLM